MIDKRINSNDYYLVITPFFPSNNSFRGSFIFDQCNAIKNNSKYDLMVYMPKSIFSKKSDYNYYGINVYFFYNINLPSNLFPGFFNFLNARFLYSKIQKTKINKNIDVIHFHSIDMGFLAKAIKYKYLTTKFVIQYHGLDVFGFSKGIFKYFSLQKIWISYFAKSIFKCIDLHIGVSKKTIENLNYYLSQKSINKIVLYNGVDKSKFYHKLKFYKSKNFIIGCVGNFTKIKDQITLIKAFHILLLEGCENIKLILVGTGPELIKCKSYVLKNNLNNNIKFIDKISHNNLNNFYNSLSLFVLPSFYEALGCVYLEAFSCGVPFIAVKGQGIEELIPNDLKSDFLFEKSNYVELSKLIYNQLTRKKNQALLFDIDINNLIKSYIDNLNNLNVKY